MGVGDTRFSCPQVAASAPGIGVAPETRCCLALVLAGACRPQSYRRADCRQDDRGNQIMVVEV
jgi:hypothetical protein